MSAIWKWNETTLRDRLLEEMGAGMSLPPPFASLIEEAFYSAVVEFMVSPKPGLVDRFHNGSHSDMNAFSFASVFPQLYTALAFGIYKKVEEVLRSDPDLPLPLLFNRVRPTAVFMENLLLRAANGVNVLKGLFFSLGCALGAATYLELKGLSLVPTRISKAVSAMTKEALSVELENLKNKADTYGVRAFSTYGIRGIRGEVADGFPSVMREGLPRLKEALNKGVNFQRACLHALLGLMSVVDDTNIVGRGGIDSLDWVKSRSREILEKGGMLSEFGLDDLLKLDEEMRERNLSPGGSADLLAITLFLYRLEVRSGV